MCQIDIYIREVKIIAKKPGVNLNMIDKFRNNRKDKIKVLLITSYKIIQESLKILIEENRDIVITDTVSNLDELSPVTETILKNVDVVIFYLLDGDIKTVEGISKLLQVNSNIRIIIVTSIEDIENQTRAIQLGAVGIVQKEQNSRILIEAIRQTYAGETWINQVLLAKLLKGKDPKKNGSNNLQFLKSETLTKRELEVVEMIGRGLKNKEIAQVLFISEATVRHHLSSIYGKAGVEDRLNLVIYAYQHGLLEVSDRPKPEYSR